MAARLKSDRLLVLKDWCTEALPWREWAQVAGEIQLGSPKGWTPLSHPDPASDGNGRLDVRVSFVPSDLEVLVLVLVDAGRAPL